MFKKNFKIILALVLSLTLLAGCTGDETPDGPGTDQGEKMKVALITSAGGLGDRSFNDAAWEGFQRAEAELGVEIKVIEPQSVADYSTSLKSVADTGYEFIMTVGNDWVDTVATVAPQYPDVKFAGVNIDVDEENVVVARFGDHEGSFLVGAFAALMTESNTVGFLGGSDVPAINRFAVGFEEGARYANPDVEVLSSYVGSFNDPGKGKEFALQLASEGADIIFHAAGKTGEGLFEAVKELDNVYAIGVDQNQDYIVPGKILTSMEKKVDVAAYDFIESVIEDTFVGETIIYGLNEGGVGITDMEHTKDLVSQEVLDQLDEIKEKVASGEIVVTDVFNQ